MYTVPQHEYPEEADQKRLNLTPVVCGWNQTFCPLRLGPRALLHPGSDRTCSLPAGLSLVDSGG